MEQWYRTLRRLMSKLVFSRHWAWLETRYTVVIYDMDSKKVCQFWSNIEQDNIDFRCSSQNLLGAHQHLRKQDLWDHCPMNNFFSVCSYSHVHTYFFPNNNYGHFSLFLCVYLMKIFHLLDTFIVEVCQEDDFYLNCIILVNRNNTRIHFITQTDIGKS